jgi:NADH-quinone oxidoreductase subunit M
VRLLALLLVGSLGAGFSAWALPRGGRMARAGATVGVLALIGVTVAAFLLRANRVNELGSPETGAFDLHLVSTVYLRLVLGLWGLQSLLLVFVAFLLGGLDRLRGFLPAILAAMAGGAAAMAAADLPIGAAMAAAGGVASLLVILNVEGPAAVAAGARELRVSLLGGAILLVSIAVVPVVAQLALIEGGVGGTGPATVTSGGVATPALGFVTLAFALVVSARWGVLPFHLRVSRLTDLVPGETLPLLLAWIAVPMTVVALAAVDRLVSPLALSLDGERLVIVLVSLATLVLAALAAFVHDDLRHASAYLVIADAGLVLLAIAALDPAAWGPGRAWVVALAASKTALLAWAVVAEDRFGTRSLPDLRGWIRRSPLLAAALIVTTVATFGLPPLLGMPAWVALDARLGLASAAADAPWEAVLFLAGLLTLPTYLRILGIGTGRPTSRVDGAPPERIVRRRKPRELLKVEQEQVAAATTTESPATPAPTPRRASAARSSTKGTSAKAATTPTSTAPALDAAAPPPTARSKRPSTPAIPAGGRAASQGMARRIGVILTRDRTELLSATVLALAILAALTSLGALDLASAAAENAPILLVGGSD